MKTTQILMEEHRHILRSLDVICRMADRVAAGEKADDHDVDCIIRFLQAFGDDHHQEKEEAILFPALLKASHAEEHECLCQIIFEHNQQRSLLEGLEDALRTRTSKDFVYYARRLAEIVRAHIQFENDDVFRRAERILSAEEDERLAKELAGYDSPLRTERLKQQLQLLDMLERKYAGPPGIAVEKAQYA